MPHSNTTLAWAQIHICVVLWGFTAILGKLITLPAAALVWWRMILVCAVLICVPRVWRSVGQLPSRLIAIYAAIGALVALHWLAFYAAIKLSNASVAVTCIAMGSVFLAFIDPWLTRRRFDARELLLGIAVIPGVALVVGGTPDSMHLGIAIGVLAAALVAVFGALNKRYISHADPVTVTSIEILSGAILLTGVAPLLAGSDAVFALPTLHDSLLLLILALLCTLLPFVLSLIALRHLTAFGAQLAVNLEPVYAILLAIPLLGEQRELNAQFYFGVAIIMAAVFVHPMMRKKSLGASH
jgi:drug/metabolite transporter (DMT)-like permease